MEYEDALFGGTSTETGLDRTGGVLNYPDFLAAPIDPSLFTIHAESAPAAPETSPDVAPREDISRMWSNTPPAPERFSTPIAEPRAKEREYGLLRQEHDKLLQRHAQTANELDNVRLQRSLGMTGRSSQPGPDNALKKTIEEHEKQTKKLQTELTVLQKKVITTQAADDEIQARIAALEAQNAELVNRFTQSAAAAPAQPQSNGYQGRGEDRRAYEPEARSKDSTSRSNTHRQQGSVHNVSHNRQQTSSSRMSSNRDDNDNDEEYDGYHDDEEEMRDVPRGRARDVSRFEQDNEVEDRGRYKQDSGDSRVQSRRARPEHVESEAPTHSSSSRREASSSSALASDGQRSIRSSSVEQVDQRFNGSSRAQREQSDDGRDGKARLSVTFDQTAEKFSAQRSLSQTHGQSAARSTREREFSSKSHDVDVSSSFRSIAQSSRPDGHDYSRASDVRVYMPDLSGEQDYSYTRQYHPQHRANLGPPLDPPLDDVMARTREHSPSKPKMHESKTDNLQAELSHAIEVARGLQERLIAAHGRLEADYSADKELHGILRDLNAQFDEAAARRDDIEAGRLDRAINREMALRSERELMYLKRVDQFRELQERFTKAKQDVESLEDRLGVFTRNIIPERLPEINATLATYQPEPRVPVPRPDEWTMLTSSRPVAPSSSVNNAPVAEPRRSEMSDEHPAKPHSSKKSKKAQPAPVVSATEVTQSISDDPVLSELRTTLQRVKMELEEERLRASTQPSLDVLKDTPAPEPEQSSNAPALSSQRITFASSTATPSAPTYESRFESSYRYTGTTGVPNDFAPVSSSYAHPLGSALSDSARMTGALLKTVQAPILSTPQPPKYSAFEYSYSSTRPGALSQSYMNQSTTTDFKYSVLLPPNKPPPSTIPIASSSPYAIVRDTSEATLHSASVTRARVSLSQKHTSSSSAQRGESDASDSEDEDRDSERPAKHQSEPDDNDSLASPSADTDRTKLDTAATSSFSHTVNGFSVRDDAIGRMVAARLRQSPSSWTRSTGAASTSTKVGAGTSQKSASVGKVHTHSHRRSVRKTPSPRLRASQRMRRSPSPAFSSKPPSPAPVEQSTPYHSSRVSQAVRPTPMKISHSIRVEKDADIGSDPLNLSKTAYEELGRRYAADRLSQLRSVVHTTDVDMADGHGTHYDHASSQSRDYRSRSTAHGASARTQPTGLSVDDLASSASSHPHKSRRSRAHSLRAQLSQIDEMLEAAKRERRARQDVYVSTRRQSLGRHHLDNAATFSGSFISRPFSRNSQSRVFEDYDQSRYEYRQGSTAVGRQHLDEGESLEDLEARVARLTQQSEQLHAALQDELDLSVRQ